MKHFDRNPNIKIVLARLTERLIISLPYIDNRNAELIKSARIMTSRSLPFNDFFRIISCNKRIPIVNPLKNCEIKWNVNVLFSRAFISGFVFVLSSKEIN